MIYSHQMFNNLVYLDFFGGEEANHVSSPTMAFRGQKDAYPVQVRGVPDLLFFMYRMMKIFG